MAKFGQRVLASFVHISGACDTTWADSTHVGDVRLPDERGGAHYQDASQRERAMSCCRELPTCSGSPTSRGNSRNLGIRGNPDTSDFRGCGGLPKFRKCSACRVSDSRGPWGSQEFPKCLDFWDVTCFSRNADVTNGCPITTQALSAIRITRPRLATTWTLNAQFRAMFGELPVGLVAALRGLTNFG